MRQIHGISSEVPCFVRRVQFLLSGYLLGRDQPHEFCSGVVDFFAGSLLGCDPTLLSTAAGNSLKFLYFRNTIQSNTASRDFNGSPP